MIISYLKMLTFLSKEEIMDIEKKHKEAPELRFAHKTLAHEIITDLHGEEEYTKAVKMSEALFTGAFNELKKNDIAELFADYEKTKVDTETLLVDTLINLKAASSKREAREFITAGAVSVNGTKITDLEYKVKDNDFIDNTYIIIKRGKKNYYIGTKEEL